MTKYRKKPIVVEAEQWFPEHPAEGVVFPVPQEDGFLAFSVEHPSCGRIETLEGPHVVSPGDWIITGIAGEKYPCKPAIFDATYEKA